MFAHYPWRDRNPICRSKPPVASWGSLITPGGIATRGGGRALTMFTGFAHYPWRDRNLSACTSGLVSLRVRSLPLEGSQHFFGGIRVYPNAVVFAHYPWRDRNSLCLNHGPRPEAFAHYPWRDRNRRPGTGASGPWCSLITPGGIATRSRSRGRVPPLGFAHYPWRDRNAAAVTSGFALIGFAHYPWRDRNPAATAMGMTVARFAHYPWRDRNRPPVLDSPGAAFSSLITPGGIATQWRSAASARRGAFAHYPWRDRNFRCWRRLAFPGGSLITPGGIATPRALWMCRSSMGSLITPGGIATQLRGSAPTLVGGCSLITPGGIATSRPRPVTGGWSPFAHYPWRDRNWSFRVLSVVVWGFAHYPWRDRNVR